MKVRIGFGYEQEEPGLYLFDVSTAHGEVIASTDVDCSV